MLPRSLASGSVRHSTPPPKASLQSRTDADIRARVCCSSTAAQRGGAELRGSPTEVYAGRDELTIEIVGGCRVITVSSGRLWTILGMAQTFIGCDRDQSFLMPPDVRDWLADDHLAWFVLDAVAGLNLGGFYGAYRRDGVGRRAYDPAMVVALLLYCYARGVRSARAIERACREDVACRVIAMLEVPDHATIARFVERHEAALAELFGQVLGLCDEAGLVRPGVVAIDGTRLAGNTSRGSNRDFGQIAREILAEAKAVDEAEDELYGDARGDETSCVNFARG